VDREGVARDGRLHMQSVNAPRVDHDASAAELFAYMDKFKGPTPGSLR
jgi:hypothetical protein